MFCMKCGKQIPDNSNVCMFCGERISNAEVMNNTTEVVTNNENESVDNNTISEHSEIDENVENNIETVTEAEEVKAEVEEQTEAEEEQTETEVEEQTEAEEVKTEVTEEVKAVEPAAMPEAPVVTPVTTEAPVSTPVAPVTPAAPVAPAKKKGNGAVIAIIIILLILLIAAGVFLFYWFSRPIYKIEQAIKNNDIATVVSLYGELTKDEDKKYVQDEMYNYAVSLEEQFIAEEIDYSFISSEYKTLGKQILKGDVDFEDIREDIDALNASREAFETAEKAYKKGDYQTAYNNYILVIRGDDNYRDAQKKAEECKALMAPYGVWEYCYDFGEYIADYMGTDDSLECNLPLYIVLEVNEDGTGLLYFDTDCFYDNEDAFVDYITEVFYDYFMAELEMPKDELDEALEQIYGYTLRDMVTEDKIFDEIVSEFEYSESEFTFYCEDNVMYVSGDIQDEAEYTIDGDTLSITFDDTGLVDIGIDMPMLFTKR